MKELAGVILGALSGLFIVAAITFSAMQPTKQRLVAPVLSEPKVVVKAAPASAPASAPVPALPAPAKLTPYQTFKKQWAEVESELDANPFRLRDAEILAMYEKLYTEVAKTELKKKGKSKHPKLVEERLREADVYEKTEARAVVEALNERLSKN